MLIFVIASVSTCAIILASVKLVVEKYHECTVLETSHDHDDIDITREIEQQKSKMKKIEELTGNSPIKQIDWIIDNGLNKFHELCTSVMDGTYQDDKINLITYREQMYTDYIEDAVVTEIRGGLGNRKLDEWVEHRKRMSEVSDLF